MLKTKPFLEVEIGDLKLHYKYYDNDEAQVHSFKM